ncbi:MAG: glutamate synthase large subunit [Treponema sp.]|jgi:glutamate synthase (NADPH/NADH) large chain|nr:glutamate synthase large subunit [Treponema sp.]
MGQGLYSKEYEHDSCGIGFVADIRGGKSHAILKRGLEVLERMEHRGAESADNKTGDGSGVLLQIPHDFYKKNIPSLGEAGTYGTGLVFLTGGEDERSFMIKTAEKMASECGLSILAWRDVPVRPEALGVIAKSAEPDIKQLFLSFKDTDPQTKNSEYPVPGEHSASVDGDSVSNLEIALYIFRKKLEKTTREHTELKRKGASCHLPSLSSRVIVYKGMLTSSQLKDYYADMEDEAVVTAVALVHSRFSTNTFPDWPLAQPFRLVAHNGEINTVKGNRFWMAARESLFSHPRFGDRLKAILPSIEPERSDSASFDNALELLVMSGRSLPHALMMLIPEAWNEKNPIPQELKDFYEYHACIMEPWDGPASMVFCDGRYVGGTLDRNGLRPSRYTITKDGLIVMGSETGVQDFKPEEVEYKGRLLPGKLLLVDLEEGRIIPDEEAKAAACKKKPYSEWAKRIITLDQSGGVDKNEEISPEQAFFMEKAFGYTREDIDRLLIPMIETGLEPTGSMGTDTPLAVFSDENQRVYNYFKQVFAQVTNPPIDSIREDLVMTLTSFVGPQANLLEETAEHCRRIKVKNPILTPRDLEQLLAVAPDEFKSAVLDATFESGDPASGGALESALDRLAREAIEAVRAGSSLITLSDRKFFKSVSCTGDSKKDSRRDDSRKDMIAIPALLATGAVHHGLIKAGLRMKASIIVESAEPREIMHFALLFGYGADVIVPYGAFIAIEAIKDARIKNAADAKKRYLKGLQKAMLKVMSKMGTSTLRSYRGAEIFEAVGLGEAVIEKCFKGTDSRIGGVGFAALEAEAVNTYKNALKDDDLLDGVGQYQWRKNREKHAWNPETIYLLQWATRTGDYKKFKQFSSRADALNQNPHVIRGLLDFAPPSAPMAPIPLERVESVGEIMKRFTTGAMSFGSISKEAHETIAAALNSIKGRSNSGEGGENPERFVVKQDGTWTRSAIKQVASGRFGVTSEYLANAEEIQIKIAQGAKPGEGGQLPGHKVDVNIAKTRYSTPGVTLISPPPHHDIYSIEDLAELIFDLKNANPHARISVKLVSESGVGTIAAGVAKAHADNILISGYDGGTGASPQSSIRHAGLPWEIGLAETHQTLTRNGLRGRVRLQTDGQLKTGRDIVIAGMLGAEEFGFGTATLIALGCVMMRKCHENTCPMGVATQDPELRKRFIGKKEHLVNYFQFLAEEVREIMASLGIRSFNLLIGRTDLLRRRASGKPKSADVDLSRILEKAVGPAYMPGGDATYCTQAQVHKIDNVLDRRLIEKCLPAIKGKTPVALKLLVKNTDRAVGAMLSYEISRRFGGEGLPDNFITIDFTGSAGQSFGAFLTKGVTFRLAGDANDYLGKGLSGGRIVVAPPARSSFASQENIIVGNTVLYGGTAGEMYIAGVAGERFCVRNSGATAIVEGTGDHAAEYMTGGSLIVLGNVGRNFAAGMSGGVAYVFDATGGFEYFLNKGMVECTGLETEEDEKFVKLCITKHVYWTDSAYAASILGNWEENRRKFVKIMPVEYKRALQQMKLAELDQRLYEIRERQELEKNS